MSDSKSFLMANQSLEMGSGFGGEAQGGSLCRDGARTRSAG
jgi:hypothetical protein